MTTSELNIHRHKFMSFIIEGLGIELQHFFYRLIHTKNYEVILFIWIDKLYYKDCTKERALKLIKRGKELYCIKSKLKT